MNCDPLLRETSIMLADAGRARDHWNEAMKEFEPQYTRAGNRRAGA
jgi:hypothetical protein